MRSDLIPVSCQPTLLPADPRACSPGPPPWVTAAANRVTDAPESSGVAAVVPSQQYSGRRWIRELELIRDAAMAWVLGGYGAGFIPRQRPESERVRAARSAGRPGVRARLLGGRRSWQRGGHLAGQQSHRRAGVRLTSGVRLSAERGCERRGPMWSREGGKWARSTEFGPGSTEIPFYFLILSNFKLDLNSDLKLNSTRVQFKVYLSAQTKTPTCYIRLILFYVSIIY